MATRKKKTMRRQKRQLQRSAKREHREVVLEYRALPVIPLSIDVESRSVEAVISSETPVPEWDFDRGEMVPRVLLASGGQFNKQVPLLDSHNRSTHKNQLGSIREIKTEDSQIVGRLFFSETAEDAWKLVQEGHLTDVSTGFRVQKETYIPTGETQIIRGKEFTGPMNVAEDWRGHEVSTTPIGADELAKMRGFEPNALPLKSEKEFEMDKELRALLITVGMDDGLSDEDAQKWLVENREKFAPAQKPEDSELAQRVDKLSATLEPLLAALAPKQDSSTQSRDDDKPVTAKEIVGLWDEREKEREKAQTEKRDRFRKNVDSDLELAFHGDDVEVPDALKRELHAMKSMDEVRARLKEEKTRRKDEAENPSTARMRMADNQPQDRHRSALGTALVLRALRESRCSEETVERMLPEADRSKDWTDFKNMGVVGFGRECLIADGFPEKQVRQLTDIQAAQAALGWPEAAGLRTSGVSAYHVTGSFGNLTLDAFNKTLLAGYGEQETTWDQVGHMGASVPDFKDKHVIRMGAIPNIPLWLDNKDPEVASMADQKVTYAVEARAVEVNFSWQLMINDDMGAISRTPQMLGTAAARTVNAVWWAQITSNPVMADGEVLFLATPANARFKSNLSTGTTNPTVTSLAILKRKMRLMRGLNTPEGNESEDILNLGATVIFGPPSLETLILQLVRSIADPAANLSSAVHNPFQSLKVVIEPLLEADSATAFYMAAPTSQIENVEMTFLQGQESPVTNSWVDERTMSRAFTIVQTYAAKAIEHRGLQRHNGV